MTRKTNHLKMAHSLKWCKSQPNSQEGCSENMRSWPEKSQRSTTKILPSQSRERSHEQVTESWRDTVHPSACRNRATHVTVMLDRWGGLLRERWKRDLVSHHSKTSFRWVKDLRCQKQNFKIFRDKYVLRNYFWS